MCGLWCTTPKNGMKLHTYGIVVHNSKICYKVMLVWACGAQILKSFKVMHMWDHGKQLLKCYNRTHVEASSAKLQNLIRSYARVRLWCKTPLNGTKLLTCGIMVHNSYKLYKVMHMWACGEEFQK